jgi:hypothetical protein
MAILTMPLAILVLTSDIAVVVFLLFTLCGIFSSNARRARTAINILIAKYSLQLALSVALVSTLGSLYFSEIANYVPCELCWFQRIFMYPQVLLLGIALLKKDKEIFAYTVPLSIIGGLISAYNYYLQLVPSAAICSANAPCSVSQFLIFGYINITVMALTGFVLLTLLGLVRHNAK